MNQPVVNTIKSSTKKQVLNAPSATVSTRTNRPKQSGTFNWLHLALTNPYLDYKARDDAKQELNSKVAFNSRTGVYFRVTAGRLSPYNKFLQSRAWFGRFNYNERIFTGSATGTVYKYLLTLNSPDWTSMDVSRASSKVIRVLKNNSTVGLIFRANGVAPTYRHGQATLDYHVHFKVLATSRINKRNLSRRIKKLTKANVNLIRINPANDRTNGYLSDQQLWSKRYNKLTGLTYGRTFQSFKKDTQKKFQARLYYDWSRPFAVYVNRANATTKYAQHLAELTKEEQTKPNHSLSLFSGSDYESEPQTSISHHHYSEAENDRRFNSLNIYSGQPLKHSTSKPYPVEQHQQMSFNISRLQRQGLFDVL